jgi:hypothetical protein
MHILHIGNYSTRICDGWRLSGAGLPNLVLVSTVAQFLRNRAEPQPFAPTDQSPVIFREIGDPSKARSYFPMDKQYLVTRGGTWQLLQLCAL